MYFGENDDLPVENVGDGDGTFIAGKPNKNLNLSNAVDDLTGRVYLVDSYARLSEEDRNAWLNEQDAEMLGFVGFSVSRDVETLAFIPYAMITTPEAVDLFVNEARKHVVNHVKDSGEPFTVFSRRVALRFNKPVK